MRLSGTKGKTTFSLGAVVMVLTLLLGVSHFTSTPASAISPKALSTYKVNHPTIVKVGTVNIAQLAKNPAVKYTPAQIAQMQKTQTFVDSLDPTKTKSSAPKVVPSVNPVKITGAKSKSGTPITTQFMGVDAAQNAATIGGDLEPPDEGMAQGNGYVFNMVNLTGMIYNTSGVAQLPNAISMAAFLNTQATWFVSDPRVLYDAPSGRWFVTGFSFSNSASEINFAVSQTSNPTGTWNIYALNTTAASDPSCPCIPDYPIIGMDGFNMYLTANEFPLSGGFNGADIWAVSKAALLSGGAPNVVEYSMVTFQGNQTYHIQPAIKRQALNAELFAMSTDLAGTSANTLAVWSLSNPGVVATGGTPTLTAAQVNSEYYAFPINPQTPVGYCTGCSAATTGLVNADFDALQEVEYINGQLFTGLDTTVNVFGVPVDGIAWFEVKAVLDSNFNVTSASHITSQGYLAADSVSLLYPHVEVKPDGEGALVFTYGGPTTDMSVGYALRLGANMPFGPDLGSVYSSTYPDNGFTGTANYGGLGRWGDYSAGSLDPITGNIWLASQTTDSGNGDQFANWANVIFEVTLP